MRTRGSFFAERLQLLIKEFGSRYALPRASGIPSSTLQGYEAAAKPGMESLLILARAANVDFNWLLTRGGEMRPHRRAHYLKDVVFVDQYELGVSNHVKLPP